MTWSGPMHATPGFLAFAYGSNLSSPRLRARTPSARFVARALLREHTLAWHKHGMDGSAKCDALFTGRGTDVVEGVVYEIASDEKPLLDAAEGLGAGYDEREVEVQTAAGPLRAWTYYATRIDASLAPFDWYKAYVLAGAREHGLSADYTRVIERVVARPDPDPERAASNRPHR